MRCSPLAAFGTGMDDDTAVLAVPSPDGEAQLWARCPPTRGALLLGITVLVTVRPRIQAVGCAFRLTNY